MLAYYSERLPAVEVNNTFYRMPAKGALAKWREQVAADFRFVLKASKRITHQSRLTDADSLAFLLESANDELGESLGAFLFQLPPFLRKDVARLRDFLALLPAGCAGGVRVPPRLVVRRRGVRRAARARRRASASPRAARRSTRRSCRPRSGATCGCGARTTTTPRSSAGWRGCARPSGRTPSSSSSTRTPAPARGWRHAFARCSETG